MRLDQELTNIASSIIDRARLANIKLVTAESCTGGLIVGTLTAIAGSSDVIEGGFVTYSNAMKSQLLGVPMDLISQHGAVSNQVARAMAAGALAHANDANLAVSVTGVAGPGQSESKPAGLVYIGICAKGYEPCATRFMFEHKNRDEVRHETIKAALSLIDKSL